MSEENELIRMQLVKLFKQIPPEETGLTFEQFQRLIKRLNNRPAEHILKRIREIRQKQKAENERRKKVTPIGVTPFRPRDVRGCRKRNLTNELQSKCSWDVTDSPADEKPRTPMHLRKFVPVDKKPSRIPVATPHPKACPRKPACRPAPKKQPSKQVSSIIISQTVSHASRITLGRKGPAPRKQPDGRPAWR